MDGVDLEVPRGTCFGLLGPNGAGKTTALRMIYGVSRPSAGEIRVFGLDIAEEPRTVRARLGVTLQENVLIETLTPAENLRVFGRYHLLREPELSGRADELLDFLELRSHADLPAAALSGGFQRRLAVAMSLMNRPDLLILSPGFVMALLLGSPKDIGAAICLSLLRLGAREQITTGEKSTCVLS